MKLGQTGLRILGAFVFVIPIALADERNTPFAEQWHGWHGHGHGIWWVFPLLMFVLCATFMLRGCRSFWCRPEQRTSEHRDHQQGFGGERETIPESARDILNKRYVRGEIDKDEYEEKSTALVPAKELTGGHAVVKPERNTNQ